MAGPSSKAAEEGRTVVWVDASGSSLPPAVVRTDAPRGRTPVLRVPLTRDHLSVIGGLTPDGRLFLHAREGAYRGPGVVRFLRHLLRHLPGKLLVVWDRSQIHRCQVVKDFLAAGAAARLQLVHLPAYAPDLNPTEGVWGLLKRAELRNVCCPALWDLRLELRLAAARLRHKRRALRGCVAHATRPPL